VYIKSYNMIKHTKW